MNEQIIIVLGPTASGKTTLAAQLAYALDTEIISVDSRQVYKDMTIGTGKDYAEYTIQGKTIPTHLIDIREAGDKYHIDAFKNDFFAAVADIRSRSNIPIACGGTALYLDAVLRNFAYTSVPVNIPLREELQQYPHETLLSLFATMPVTAYTPLADTSTTKRLIRAIEINRYLATNTFTPTPFPTVHPIAFGMLLPTAERRSRIAQRLRSRLQHGLIEEVQLLRTRIPDEQLEYYGLEYNHVTRYLQGKRSFAELEEGLTTAIQQFAKRQMTYFRKMEREGLTIHWIDATLPVEAQLAQVKHTLAAEGIQTGV